MNTNLEHIFKNVIKRVNPFTPVITNYIKINNHICELSQSHWDIRPNEKLYGCTVITETNNGYEYNSKLSKAFSSHDERSKYIKTLENGNN